MDPDYLEHHIFSSANHALVSKYSKKSHAGGVKIVRPKDDQVSAGASTLVARFKGVANKYRLPKNGIDPQLAYDMIHDDLTLDGSTVLNLASFVNVHTEDQSLRLITENLTKNLADNDEYPMLIELQNRCISILANMWHAPLKLEDSGLETPHHTHNYTEYQSRAIGTPTTGSSEAIMLGGLAMKKNWMAKRRAAGLSTEKPNILMASCCQVALEKFARYFDVECRLIGVSKKDYLIDYTKIRANLDENTIGIFVIVGSTYTGGFESVEKVNAILDDFEAETGHSVPIHVDGASGGFVAPFIYPELKWDFRVPRVMSINTSGHKFGLVTAGLGWVIFRTESWLPDELKFQLSYLGGVEESFSLNFSRSGYQVVHQYYNFIHLGARGYTEIFDNCLLNARLLSCFLEETGYFTCISDLHLPVGMKTRERDSNFTIESIHGSLGEHSKFNPALPVVSFQFTKEFSADYPEIPQVLISKLLRNRGWIIPNYHLPKCEIVEEEVEGPQDAELDGENDEILRVVVKYDLTAQLLDKLMHDIVEIVDVAIRSVEMVRENVKKIEEEGSEIGDSVCYNMLLSIANDGDRRLIAMRDNKATTVHHHKGVC